MIEVYAEFDELPDTLLIERFDDDTGVNANPALAFQAHEAITAVTPAKDLVPLLRKCS